MTMYYACLHLLTLKGFYSNIGDKLQNQGLLNAWLPSASTVHLKLKYIKLFALLWH